MSRMSALVVSFLLMSATVFAQEAAVAEEPASPAAWLKYIAMAITAIGVPAMVELLKKYWPKAPAIVKQITSLVAGSLLMSAAAWLTTALGYPIDFTELITYLTTGTGLGLAATAGFKAGKQS